MIRRIAVTMIVLAGCGKPSPPPAPTVSIEPAPSAIAQSAPPAIGWRTPARRAFAIEPHAAAAAQADMPATALNRPLRVPFVRFAGDRNLEFDPVRLRARLIHPTEAPIAFDEPGVPVEFIELDGGLRAVFFRGLPRNRLSLHVLASDGRTLAREALGPAPDLDYMFRAAIRSGDALLAVLYDNARRKNTVVEWRIAPQGLRRTGRALDLPTFEVPAGGNYEMEPPVLLHAAGSAVELFAGTLHARIEDMQLREPKRLVECVRALEAVAWGSDRVALCDAKAGHAEHPLRLWSRAEDARLAALPARTIAWDLRVRGDTITWKNAASIADLRALLGFDIERAQHRGLLEFGADNVEGRLPWAQAYYLWGWLDSLYLARTDALGFELFGPLVKDIKLRLDLEMHLIDRLLGSALGYRTRGFTVDRSNALFAVQTGRLLVLLERYRREVPNPVALANYAAFRERTLRLEGHIDVLARSGEAPRWMPAGTHHLRWPKGSAFYFDGTPVPFNHQNEWAYAVFESAPAGAPVRRAAHDIIAHFMRHIAPDGRLPENGEWDYWWGRAWDGWTRADGVSVHRPEYSGDKGKAWISFKTIDVMSLLAARASIGADVAQRFAADVAALVERGKVFPFAAYSSAKLGEYPAPPFATVAPYARIGAPWDIGNAVWALYWLAGLLPSAAPAEGSCCPMQVN